MKDFGSLHQKVQEHIDCYAATDPLKEMSELKGEDDAADGALKWLALAALHGVNNNAKKITIAKNADGDIVVTAKYRKSELPAPGAGVGEAVFKTIRDITHIDGDKGKTPLALGLRDSSVDVQVKIKSDAGCEKVTIKFPA